MNTVHVFPHYFILEMHETQMMRTTRMIRIIRIIRVLKNHRAFRNAADPYEVRISGALSTWRKPISRESLR